MNPNESTASIEKNYTWLYLGLVVIAVIIAILSSTSSVRNVFSGFPEPHRSILGKIFGEFGSTTFVIFKVKTESGIEIEVYEKDFEGKQKFKQKFLLPEDMDAYLMVNNASLNLGLNDVDKDGALDIIAPTVDRNGNSRLNVFRYDGDLKQFTPVSTFN